MKQFKVVYETISGGTRDVIVKEVNCISKETAKNYVLCNYPDCFSIITVTEV